MSEHVRIGVVPQLVATGVEEPPVVTNGECEREHGEPLHRNEAAEEVRGPDRQHELFCAP